MKKFIFKLCALSLFVSIFSDVKAAEKIDDKIDDNVFRMSDTESATPLTEADMQSMLDDEKDSGPGVVSQDSAMVPAPAMASEGPLPARGGWVKAQRPPIKLASRRKSQNPLKREGRDDAKGEMAIAEASPQPSEVRSSPMSDNTDEEGEVFPFDFRLISCLKDWGDGTSCPLPHKFLFNEETFKGITPQPSMSELQNKVGKELVKWHEKRGEHWEPLRDAILLKGKTQERLSRKQKKPVAVEILAKAQENDTVAERALEAIKKKYMQLHPKLSWDDMQRDFAVPKPIKLDLAYYSSKPKVRVEPRRQEKNEKGVVISSPVDLDIAISMLVRLVQDIHVEQEFFKEICSTHRFYFHPQVSGWTGTLPFKKWWCMGNTIWECIDGIYARYPIRSCRERERDETTDQGYALAKFNKDQLGKFRRKIWSKITRFDKLIAQQERKGIVPVEVVNHRVFIMDELHDDDAPRDNSQLLIDLRFKTLPDFIDKEEAPIVKRPIHFLNVFKGSNVDEVRLVSDPVTLHRAHFILILEELHQGQSKLLLRRGHNPRHCPLHLMMHRICLIRTSLNWIPSMLLNIANSLISMRNCSQSNEGFVQTL
ncbi:MAG: hypothetical protein K2Y18_00145 [Alphaproteobacteria bacterium]|nr:hypothetical protein [Alphaproteobacteria bacterium]